MSIKTNVNTMVRLSGETMKEIKNIAKIHKSKKSMIPALSTIKIEVLDGYKILVSYASSGNLYIQKELQTIENDINNETTFLIPIDTIKKITRIKKTSVYSFEIGEQLTLKFNNDGIQTTINTYDPEEFPKLPIFSELLPGGNIYYNDLINLNNAAISTYKEEVRPVLKNVVLRDGAVYSTDSHRLYKTTCSSLSNEKDILLHSSLIDALAKNENKKDFVATLKFNDNYVLIETHNSKYYYYDSFGGTFPDVSRLIPSEYKTSFTISDIQQLKDITEACAKLTKNVRNNVMKFTVLDNNTLEVSAIAEGQGEVKQQLDINSDYLENDFKIAFSSKYLLDAIKQLENKYTSGLTFNFTGPMRPFVVTEANNNDSLALILPVRTY